MIVLLPCTHILKSYHCPLNNGVITLSQILINSPTGYMKHSCSGGRKGRPPQGRETFVLLPQSKSPMNLLVYAKYFALHRSNERDGDRILVLVAAGKICSLLPYSAFLPRNSPISLPPHSHASLPPL